MPTTAPAPQTTLDSPASPGTLLIPISSPFDTILRASCLSILPSSYPCLLAKPTQYLVTGKGPSLAGTLHPAAPPVMLWVHWGDLKRPPRPESGQQGGIQGEILLAPSSCPTSARRMKQDGLFPLGTGELETQGERGHGPKVTVPSVPREHAASRRGSSAPSGTARLPQVLPITSPHSARWDGCFAGSQP